MGWKQFLREVDRAQRRSERAALQHHRQLVRERARMDKIAAKIAEQDAAQAEVAEFESYLEVLVSVHKDCGDNWNWQRIANSKQPAEPKPATGAEDEARIALATYRPSFFDKLLRRVEKRRSDLERKVQEARERDREAHEAALAAHRKDVAAWELKRSVAASVLQGSPEGYKRALDLAEPFAEIAEFKTRVVAAHVEADVVALTCFLEDEELVPDEELKLTSSGKVSRKSMPAGRYWALHQDYVCSCALRVARETFSVLPINRVIVNMSARRMDSSTGHVGDATILAVHFTRPALQALNVAAIDPSDSLKNFNFRMSFKKSAGFEVVEPIGPDEQWVSA